MSGRTTSTRACSKNASSSSTGRSTIGCRHLVIAQLLFLEREDADKDIDMYINSPGGSVTAGLAIYDTMQLIKPDVATICAGMAASMASVLLTGGAHRQAVRPPVCEDPDPPALGPAGGWPGHGYRNPRSRPHRDAPDLSPASTRQTTKKPIDQILKDIERDYYMTAEEAREYGIVDQVFTKENRTGPPNAQACRATHVSFRGRERPAEVQLLRQVAGASAQVDRRPRRLHLR